jgi:hypothetical protein
VLLLVSMTFLRSPVLAIFAIILDLPNTNVDTKMFRPAQRMFS